MNFINICLNVFSMYFYVARLREREREILINKLCSMKIAYNASCKRIDPCHPMQSMQADMGLKFLSIFCMSKTSHDLFGCWTKCIFNGSITM